MAAHDLLAPGAPSRVAWATAAMATLRAVALTGFAVALGSLVDGVVRGDGSPAWVWSVAVALILLAGLTRWAQTTFTARAAAVQEGWLRERLTRHALGRGFRWLSSQSPANLGTLLTQGVDKHVEYRTVFMGPAIGSLLAPLATIVTLAVLVDPWSGLWLGLLLPLAPLIIGGFQRFTRRSPAAYRRAQGVYARRFLDSVQGLTSLRLLNAHHRRAAQLDADGETVRRGVMGVLWANQLLVLILDLTFALVLLGGSGVIALTGVESARLSGGEALALVLVSYVLLTPTEYVGAFFYIGMGGRAAEKDMKDLLAGEAQDLLGWQPSEPQAAEVVMRDATFSYADEPAVRGLNLDLPVGSQTTLVGPSGSGKSTALALIQGLLDPDSGSVGRDGYGRDADWLQRHTSLVGQGATLLRGTVAENLRFASPDASDEQLWEALRRVGLAEEIESLDLPVGELGHGVSGGQAQRIAIARVLLADRPILLLDEPTSSLDGPTEKAVLAALAEAAKGRTVLSIAHRKSALDADARVLTLEGGELR